MIEPGKITLELILNRPEYYLVWIYLIPVALSAVAAYFADRAADEKVDHDAKETNEAVVIYEFQSIKDPIAWGAMAGIAFVLPMASTIDAVADWAGVWSFAIGIGLVARVALMRLAYNTAAKLQKT